MPLWQRQSLASPCSCLLAVSSSGDNTYALHLHFTITDEKIFDCGLFQYLKNKDLYVYLMFVDCDIHELFCDSKFELHGKMVNEIVGYKWTDDFRLFYKSLQPIIQECLEHYDEGYYEEIN